MSFREDEQEGKRRQDEGQSRGYTWGLNSLTVRYSYLTKQPYLHSLINPLSPTGNRYPYHNLIDKEMQVQRSKEISSTSQYNMIRNRTRLWSVLSPCPFATCLNLVEPTPKPWWAGTQLHWP